MHLDTLALSDERGVQRVRALLEVVHEYDEHVPLSDAKWLQLRNARAERFTAVVAREDPDGPVVAYAHLSSGSARRDLEIVVDPSRRREGIDEVLLDHCCDLVAQSGGGTVHFWTRDPTADDEAALAARGFASAERLLQFRRPLDDGLPEPVFTPGTRLRSFAAGRDEQAWLRVNHEAFSRHRDQGGWDLEELEMRVAEPWFDPAGFLVTEDDEGMSGFCWTKVHNRPKLGEIYLIAAHPSRHGRGLGRALVLAGLHSLRSRGLRSGMLYTDASNEAAVHLYTALGFDVHHVHRTYVRDVAAHAAASGRA